MYCVVNAEKMGCNDICIMIPALVLHLLVDVAESAQGCSLIFLNQKRSEGGGELAWLDHAPDEEQSVSAVECTSHDAPKDCNSDREPNMQDSHWPE